jgi:hypothetical protein
MKTFHIDEPREIGKKRLRISPKDKLTVKKALTEIAIKEIKRRLEKKNNAK